MAEKLYTIPVNEAFEAESECPICTMYQKLEDSAIRFVLGPSYMEEDVRSATNESGFCKYHMKTLMVQKNRLGIALILKTHIDEQKKQAEAMAKKAIKPKALLKKVEDAPVGTWAVKKADECYICNRIDEVFGRYLDTVMYLYKKEPAFREKYKNSKGFCQEHYGRLILKAQEELKADELNEFVSLTTKLYTDNLQRLSDDLEWFAVKFDYRFKDEPWKNSKDAIERAVTKTNGIVDSEIEL